MQRRIADIKPPENAGDCGFTLVEVLVATAIAVSTAIVVTNGMGRMLMAERSAMQSSEGALLLRTAEAVHNNPIIAADEDGEIWSGWSANVASGMSDDAEWSFWELSPPSGRSIDLSFAID